MSTILTPAELAALREYRHAIAAANRNNVWCHCRQCDREWIASSRQTCKCGSRKIEYVLCWQFPDD
ncbi:MAG: hypothetical protein AAGB13_11875 [Cyanobacteria bacterium P01_F01_bin.33]